MSRPAWTHDWSKVVPFCLDALGPESQPGRLLPGRCDCLWWSDVTAAWLRWAAPKCIPTPKQHPRKT